MQKGCFVMEKYIEQTMQALEKNNMKPYYVETAHEVVPLVKSLMKKGESVSCGGSVTINETNVFTEILESGEYDFIDRRGLQGEKLRQAYGKAFMCDTFITSSNAVTQNGELYNVDGNSNRVACIVFGPRQVIVVVGKNKIVPNIDDAIRRVKEIAAPKNTVRLNCNTPCAKTGECISLKHGKYICDGCASEGRVCCNYVVTAQQRHKDRIKVIIVNENLGY